MSKSSPPSEASRRTYLLGAGASIEAGVPAAADMVRRIQGMLYQGSATLRAFNAAVTGLQAHNAAHLEDPFAPIDVEDLYATLRDLAGRHTHRLAPFVGSWSQVVLGAGQSTRVETRAVVREIAELLRASGRSSGRFDPSPSTSRLDHALRDMLNDAVLGDQSTFERAAETVWEGLIELANIRDSAKVAYLVPLVATAHREPVWIASLNYDLGIELAAKANGIDVEIGVTKGPVQFPPAAPLTLAKLHGSIDWKATEHGIERVTTPLPQQPTLIFGAGNKLRISGPFLDLLFAFRSRLDQTDQLQVCGYSFRDEHVNHLIDNWLMRSSERKLLVFDPGLTAEDVHNRLVSDKFDYYARRLRADQISVHALKASDWAASTFVQGSDPIPSQAVAEAPTS